MRNDVPNEQEPSIAKIQPHGRFSWVWLIPIVAASLVVFLAYTSYSKRGPLITLTFNTANGLQVDQTLVKHKAVPLGTVEDIDIAPDMTHVIVHVRMAADAKSILTDHARFWVVRPRLSAGSLTGLDTLVSGSYIEVDPGAPGGKKQHQFTGLEEPPGRQSDEPGRVFVLKADRLGSLSAGAPVYNRDVEVGEVLSYELGDATGDVTMRLFIREPFDRRVHAKTRFWNVSGLSVTMGAEGMHIELASLQSLLSGGIAFDTPLAGQADPPADDNATFPLFADKATADAAFYKENVPYVTYFETSIQGLAVGAPVQLFGVQVGTVTDLRLVYDEDKGRMVARVGFNIQPERILNKASSTSAGQPSGVAASAPQNLRRTFLENGLKAQLESTSLLTGAKDIAIIYSANSKSTNLVKEGDAFVIPGQGGGLDGLTASLSDVASKVDKIPFEQIGVNVNKTLDSFQHLANQIDTNATPALQRLPTIVEDMSKAVNNANSALGAGGYGQNSEFQHGMERTLNNVNDAARSFRVLAEYLDRHPEALIRGRSSGSGGSGDK